MYTIIHTVMLDLIENRKRLMSGTLTQEQSQEIKARITAKIDSGNKYCISSQECLLFVNNKHYHILR